MVDSLPPSGTDPDNQTIITNSNGELEVIESTVYLGNFAQDSGDWTGIDNTYDDVAKVEVPRDSTASASVTADLTDVDVLTFRISPGDTDVDINIYFDGVQEGQIQGTYSFETLEISNLDYGANTTIKIEAINTEPDYNYEISIDYVRGVIQPESRKMELVDAGGL